MAVREAWANAGMLRGDVVVRFILSEDERTSQVSKEVEVHQDIVFLQAGSFWQSTCLSAQLALLFS